MREGWFLFQAARLALTDDEHCFNLLAKCNIPKETQSLVDMGCGIGELSIHWSKWLPSCRFYCVTSSGVQANIIQRRSSSIRVLHADFHAVPLAASSVDVVLFSESFGYGNSECLLTEAHRILSPGEIILIKDFLCQTDPYCPAWSYTFRSPDFIQSITKAGFTNVDALEKA